MIDWTRLEFLQPIWLWLLPFTLLLFWVGLHRRSTIKVSSVQGWSGGPRSWKIQLRWIPTLIFSLGWASWVCAAASPRIGNRQTEIQRDGIAMMMVVDTSSSMLALDLSPEVGEQTRLDVVKDTVVDFVQGGNGLTGRNNDMVGLIRFAGFADTTCPLTFDHLNLTSLTQNLEITSIAEEDGTAIGDALTLAVSRLSETEAQTRIIVLLTDGSNNAGEETPQVAATLAESQGIKIYSIGVGTNGMAPIRLKDPRTGRSQVRRIPVQIDDELLEQISSQTNGQYFRATNNQGLQEVVATIDQLEKTILQEKRYREYTEYFTWLLISGGLLFILSIVLENSIFRRVV